MWIKPSLVKLKELHQQPRQPKSNRAGPLDPILDDLTPIIFTKLWIQHILMGQNQCLSIPRTKLLKAIDLMKEEEIESVHKRH